MAFKTFPLAGAAYGSNGQLLNEEKACLTHSYDPETQTVCCGRVNPDSVLEDEKAIDTSEPPTCKTCFRKDPRFAKPRKS